MAQDFESTGTQITNSETTLLTANSDDAIIGLRLANITTSSVTVDIYIDISPEQTVAHTERVGYISNSR